MSQWVSDTKFGDRVHYVDIQNLVAEGGARVLFLVVVFVRISRRVAIRVVAGPTAGGANGVAV